MADEIKDDPQYLAEQHVDWFLEIIRPLLISEFLHGYKHGQEKVSGESE